MQLLGRHIEQRAHYLRVAGNRAGHGFFSNRGARLILRQAKIQQLRSGGREHDVAGFQVAMDDAPAVRGAQRAGRGNGDLEYLVERQRPSLDASGQGLPLKVFHDQVVGTDVVQRANAGMVERGNGVGLRLKPLAEGFSHNLDGDFPPQPGIHGFVNLAHPAGGDEAEDAESSRQHRPFRKLRDGASASNARLPTGGLERNVPAWSCSASSRSTSARMVASEDCSFKNEERCAGSCSRADSKSALTAAQLSFCVAMGCFELSVEPRFGHTPVALHRFGGDSQQVCRLFYG